MLRYVLTAALLLAAPLAARDMQPTPLDVAPAVATTNRPAAATALDAGRKPAEVLRFFGLQRGDRVLDVMAGGGYYSEIIGDAIGPRGSVAALVPPASLAQPGAQDKWTALTTRVPNVRLLAMQPSEASFAPASFDFVLMHLTYHDLYWTSAKYHFPTMDPAVFLKAVYAATRPGGTVGVVDHVALPGGDTRAVVDKLHRIDPAVIKADFARAGFVLEDESRLLRNPNDDHTTLVFDPAIRGQTDRVVYRFRKPGGMVSRLAR